MILKPGTVLDDRYELVAPLEGIGVGATWRARDPDAPLRISTVTLLARVDDGAIPPALAAHLRALRGLRHRNVLATTGHGVWEDHPYVVHGPLDGVSLALHLGERCMERTPWPLAHIEALFQQIAAAVMAAHAASPAIVHGALDPRTVVIATEGDGLLARVVDFGLAPFVVADGAQREAMFIAPEQRGHATPDAGADVFSLAQLLRAMLCAPHAARDDVPDAVWDALSRATAPLPQRFPSVSALVEALALAWKAPLVRAPAPQREAPPAAPPALPVFPPLRPPPAAAANPWATDVRMERVKVPEGFLERAYAASPPSRIDEAVATEVTPPWRPPERSATAAYAEAPDRTEALSTRSFREPSAAPLDDHTRRAAPFTAPDAPDELTVRVAPFRLDAAPREGLHATTPAPPAEGATAAVPRTSRVALAAALCALVALAIVGRMWLSAAR